MDAVDKPRSIQFKGATDLVTDTDRASEDAILAVIRDAFPGHAVLGEEGGVSGDTSSEYLWCVDPLDGTTNFAHGYPSFAVCVAVLRHTTPVASTGAAWLAVAARMECLSSVWGRQIVLLGMCGRAVSRSGLCLVQWWSFAEGLAAGSRAHTQQPATAAPSVTASPSRYASCGSALAVVVIACLNAVPAACLESGCRSLPSPPPRAHPPGLPYALCPAAPPGQQGA
jgi:fructose-1,6-bisphosphatase/inositol monophosphatase family enzyme